MALCRDPSPECFSSRDLALPHDGSVPFSPTGPRAGLDDSVSQVSQGFDPAEDSPRRTRTAALRRRLIGKTSRSFLSTLQNDARASQFAGPAT